MDAPCFVDESYALMVRPRPPRHPERSASHPQRLNDQTRRGGTHLDLGGVALVSLALLLLFVPLIEGREAGWPAWTSLSLASSVLAMGVFAVFLQVGRGLSPIQAALTFAPSAIGFFVTSLLAPKVVPLFGRHVLSFGFGVAAFGYILVATLLAAAGATVNSFELAPAVLLIGLGQGLAVTPLVGTILSAIDPRDAGSASGAMSTTLQIGSVTGVAVLSIVFFALAGQPASADLGPAYAAALAGTLPISALLAVVAVVAVVLVRVLPTVRTDSANALIERVPSWAAGLAYSMYLATGGRLGQQLLDEILGETIERRTRRTLDAPPQFGDFLAFHFERSAAEDTAWLNFLQREALSAGEGPIAHESERLPVIQRQVDEIRRRQAAGTIPSDLDPALVRLMAFALSSYPRLLPQITRLTTGKPPSDPEFGARWTAFLEQVGRRLSNTP